MPPTLSTTPHDGHTNEGDSEFAWRVLDQLSSAVLVVDTAGTIVYANPALVALAGRTGEHAAGQNILDYIHPDDLAWLAEAFLDLTQSRETAESGALPSIHVRLLSPDGEPIPVEVTGARSVSDNVIGGVIYDIRPARHHDLLSHLLAGVSTGAKVVDLLRLVTQMIAMPPMQLDAAVLELSPAGWSVLTSTSEQLSAALHTAPVDEFNTYADTPHRCEPGELNNRLESAIARAGYADTWRLSVASTLVADVQARYEIVTCNNVHQRLSPGVEDRLSQARELARIVMMRAQNERLMRHAASHDSLTGLFNRAEFRSRLDAALRSTAPVASGAEGMSVIFLDLDGFKPINDNHGHAAGDAVLTVVADRIRASVRGADVVARLGGDEFAVLLGAEGRSLHTQQAIADRIVGSVGAPINLPAVESIVRVTASAGLADIRPGDSVDGVLRRADHLMYEAKRAGGSRVRDNAATPG